jgi:drug/metabolite transporter (DMT)-like permease
MLGASLAFAAMAACIKLASQHAVPIAQIVFYRGLISLLLMYGYLSKRRVPIATPHWKAHVRRGVIGFVSMSTYVPAIALLPLATAVTLNYTSPVMLALMLLVIHRERPQPPMIASMVAGFGGIVLLLRPSYDGSQWFGGLIALVSAVTAAMTALNIRALGRLEEPPSRTVLYFSLCITIGALPWFLLSNPTSLDAEGAVYVIGSGVAATVGQMMLTHAYQRGHTLLVSLLGYSQVVFTSLLGIVIWNDRPSIISWSGMMLVIASGAAATMFARPATAPRRQRAYGAGNEIGS